MDIKMPDGVVLSTNNQEVIKSYIENMGGKEVTTKQVKKSATKVASAKEAE